MSNLQKPVDLRLYAKATENAATLLALLKGYRKRFLLNEYDESVEENELDVEFCRENLSSYIVSACQAMPEMQDFLGLTDEELHQIERGGDIPLYSVEQLIEKVNKVRGRFASIFSEL